MTTITVVVLAAVLLTEAISFGRVKRADIDLQTCIDNFNVHRDKIIRTQDSQNMGAKYLNEIDLGSREECLRLCCETDNCDVFVFEEKNSGSCYLFHCGPPEDFKCKFTHHVNYSSAVLSINRHLPDLESQIKLTKHEQDLTKLRRTDTEPNVKTVLTEAKPTFTTTTTTTAPKDVSPLRKSKTDEVPALNGGASSSSSTSGSSKCSRFQFECRSNSECIAIYNACDGVPQCADGSDEAPELGCPDLQMANAPPPPNDTPSVAQKVGQQQLGAASAKQRPAIVYDGGVSNVIQLPPVGSQLRQQQQNIPPAYQPVPAVAYPNGFPQVPPIQDFVRPDPVPVLKQQPYRLAYDGTRAYAAGQPQWLQPHQGNQNQQQVGQQTQFAIGKNGHIYNHKENDFRMAETHDSGQIQYGDPNMADYNKMGNSYYGDSYRQPIQQENWPAAVDMGGYDNQGFYQEKVNPVEDQLRKTPNYKPPPRQMPDIKPETVNPKHVQEKLAHDLKHSKDNMEHGNVEKKPKIDKHHHDQYPDVVAIRIEENDLQDGIAQTPKGAILSVTLGLVITFIMAIMIVCRLRMVRRRIRKGGKSYAHDADFLVNGMYL